MPVILSRDSGNAPLFLSLSLSLRLINSLLSLGREENRRGHARV